MTTLKRAAVVVLLTTACSGAESETAVGTVDPPDVVHELPSEPGDEGQTTADPGGTDPGSPATDPGAPPADEGPDIPDAGPDIPDPGPDIPDDGPEIPDEGPDIPGDDGGDDTPAPPAFCATVECDDLNECTLDQCDEDLEVCTYTPIPFPCEDGEPCTAGDQCDDQGVCQPGDVTPSCDDGSSCTLDVCEFTVGCVHTPASDGGPCNDGDTCTTGEHCDDGICGGGTLPDCDDGDFCTVDVCVNAIGCVSEPAPAQCDDGNGCTADTCDAVDGCDHVVVQDGTGCEDGDPCTEGDTCKVGQCETGPDEADCDDANPCTTDACLALTGCVHTPLADGTVCDDGNEATVSDVCKTGSCKGVADDCAQYLGLQWPTMKVTSMTLGSTTDDAMDLDGDGQKDNALGPIALFINGPIEDALDAGNIMYVAHLQELSETQTFPVHFFLGSLAPSTPNCAFQSQVCDYLVQPTGFSDDCIPVSTFPDVSWDGQTLESQSAGLFVLTFAFSGQLYDIEVQLAQIDVPAEIDGATVESFDGRVGGAIDKQDLLDLASLIDAGVPLDDLIDSLIDEDIDADGDGEPESVSLILLVSGIGGDIVGTLEP